MRHADETKAWPAIKKQRKSLVSAPISIGKIDLDLSAPCIVLGGRNGAGKSRLMRDLASRLGDKALLLDLHYLCEQALIVLRSREDFEDMKAEFEILGPDVDRRDDVQQIIGREYESVDWYALEVEPESNDVATRFRWGGEQPLLPYFEAKYRGFEYTSRDMGLGEFSVHFLFWILEQYRGVDDLTLLLDEPDAYLPPIGASGLVNRLLTICLQRNWRLILTTHSSEIISQAIAEEAFVLLQLDAAGDGTAIHCQDDPTVADMLLEVPPVRHVLFVEDESAWMLTRVLVEALDRKLAQS